MRKHGCAAGLLTLLLVVGAVDAEAQSITGFPCQIDLGQNEDESASEGAFEIDPTGSLVPEELRRSFGSFRQQKVCQGQGQNVGVNCDALIPDWPSGRRLDASGFTCLINVAECGITVPAGDLVDGLAVAGSASLRIVPTQSSRCGQTGQPRPCGFATLECRLN